MLRPFSMKVQGIDRTLADKVFAICDYYLQDKVQKHSRHIYDIYKLLPLVPQDETFKNLVQEVRNIRAQSPICPSALPNVNVTQLLEQIIEEKAYKNDYDNLTTQLLEEQIPYEIVIDSLKNIAKSDIFKQISKCSMKNRKIRYKIKINGFQLLQRIILYVLVTFSCSQSTATNLYCIFF